MSIESMEQAPATIQNNEIATATNWRRAVAVAGLATSALLSAGCDARDVPFFREACEQQGQSADTCYNQFNQLIRRANAVNGGQVVDPDAFFEAGGLTPGEASAARQIMTPESGMCAWKVQGKFGACPPAPPAPSRVPKSGGYGLCQSTPPQKMASAGPDWVTNPYTQLKWCDSYVKGRYGGWLQALGYRRAHGNF